MRIAFVSYEFHPITQGGCGTFVSNAARDAAERGIDVTLLLYLPTEALNEVRLWCKTNARGPGHMDVRGIEPSTTLPRGANIFEQRSWDVAHALIALCQDKHYDYIELFDYCGIAYFSLVAKARGLISKGTTLSIRAHGSIEAITAVDPEAHFGTEEYDQFALERASAQLAEVLMVPSRAYAERYLPKSATRIIVDKPVARPLPVVHNVNGNRDVVLFYGRLMPVKGADTFVLAALEFIRRHPLAGYRFVLAGYDNHRIDGQLFGDLLRSWVPPDLRDRFTFLGGVSHEQIAQTLGAVSCAIFPNRFETFCYAAHEVYSAHYPLIVNRIPAFIDGFGGRPNVAFFDGTVDGLVAALEQRLNSSLEPWSAEQTRDPPSVPYSSRRRRDLWVEQPGLSATIYIVCDGSDASEAAQLASTLVARHVKVYAVRKPRAEETLTVSRFLGEPRVVESLLSQADDGLTCDAALVLHAGDRIAADVLDRALSVLRRSSDVGYVALTPVIDGVVTMRRLDIAPECALLEDELWPLRVLQRTTPGLPVTNVFVEGVGAFGEAHALCRLRADGRSGSAWPTDVVEVSQKHSGRHRLNGKRVMFENYAAADDVRLIAQRAFATSNQIASPGAASISPPRVRELFRQLIRAKLNRMVRKR